MRVTRTDIEGILILEPAVHRDARGGLAEWWRKSRYAEAGITDEFVQDNVSWSKRNVLRGLHYQQPRPQSKLISVLSGTIFDVAVDLRPGSATFGKWFGVELSFDTMKQFYIPAGFAHGYVVLSDEAIVSYKCGDYYVPEYDRVLRWDDPDIGVGWPVTNPILSDKDANAPFLTEVSLPHRV